MASHLLRGGGPAQSGARAAGQQRLRQGAAFTVQPCESLATQYDCTFCESHWRHSEVTYGPWQASSGEPD